MRPTSVAAVSCQALSPAFSQGGYGAYIRSPFFGLQTRRRSDLPEGADAQAQLISARPSAPLRPPVERPLGSAGPVVQTALPRLLLRQARAGRQPRCGSRARRM